MDFLLTQEQRDLGELTNQLLTKRREPHRRREPDTPPTRFDRELWTLLGSSGVLDAAFPTELGGSGCGFLETCSVLIELGRAIAPAPYLSSIVLAASALGQFGTAEQWRHWGRPTASGQLIGTAALAADADPDRTAPPLDAERLADGWRLDGSVALVPAGAIADYLLLAASTPHGPTVFLVSADDPGVTRTEQRIVDGDDEPTVSFAGVPLGTERVLGDPGEAERIIAWLLARGTVGVCAHQLGVTERALAYTAEYATNRVQFDRPIGTFQAVTQRLADAYIDVEAIRLTMWQAAWRLAEELPDGGEIATAKFWAAEGGHRVLHTAVHIHGGVGIDLDYPLSGYFVAGKRNEFTLGAATAQLRALGRILAEPPLDC
ncbi:acyl-CoA dehydrogenase [Tamaricihabitans halophyticus]|uniref:Acyl-CoA dehydrogenase n=1 Tax=Tamaricihabitans halophyticus TaxID=1262583 RepID=A0A4R2Q9W8_9PSEU|nr:acyl-CoA dehydrogenase family protein [Tamaricihabitans halophyticus]TCP45379.1 acyl-CoA dehydrogenase [Tamaricihabitans halophyticus]